MDAFLTNELNPLLDELLSTMQIPKTRRDDYRWIKRNLAFQNEHHPDFERTMGILTSLLRAEEL